MHSLLDASFRAEFWSALPHDEQGGAIPRFVSGVCASAARAEPVSRPELVAWSGPCAAELGLAAPTPDTAPGLAALLSGNQTGSGSQPYAMRYGGHQFGHWADQLGDGRVINLGELRDARGVLQTLQLKGAGRTAYSRGADGRAVLRSSLREYVLSEAMHHLGVPTSRALALVLSGDQVERDMFYDGRPQLEPGAIVTRVAPSFVRLGNFELHAAHGETGCLRALADFCVERHFPAQKGDDLAWFAEVCRRNAHMVAHWMALGFVHGVLNTDNTSILGLSIDYGPFGWLEETVPDWTPNTTDAEGRRYCYARQPAMIQWNLACLGSALLSLGLARSDLEAALAEFQRSYQREFRALMAARLGLSGLTDDDDEWFDALYRLLVDRRCDWPLFWRRLAALNATDEPAFLALLDEVSYAGAGATAEQQRGACRWWREWQQRLSREAGTEAERRDRMRASSPAVVPRNWLLSEAIDAAAQGDWKVLDRLMAAIREPFAEPADSSLMQMRPAWAESRAGCSMLSCSS